MYWLIFLLVSVTAQNDTSILDSIAYKIDTSVKPTLSDNTTNTVIQLSTKEFNISKELNPVNQSETVELTLERLATADSDYNDVNSIEVTEDHGFLPTETYRYEKENKTLEFYPKRHSYSMKGVLPTTSSTFEEQTIPYESSTMIIPIDNQPIETESNHHTPTPSLPESLPDESTTPFVSSLKTTTSETKTVNNEVTSMEPSLKMSVLETSTDNYGLTSIEPTTTYTSEQPTTIYLKATPVTSTESETTPMLQLTPSQPLQTATIPVSSTTAYFQSTQDTPAPADPVETTTMNVVTPSEMVEEVPSTQVLSAKLIPAHADLDEVTAMKVVIPSKFDKVEPTTQIPSVIESSKVSVVPTTQGSSPNPIPTPAGPVEATTMSEVSTSKLNKVVPTTQEPSEKSIPTPAPAGLVEVTTLNEVSTSKVAKVVPTTEVPSVKSIPTPEPAGVVEATTMNVVTPSKVVKVVPTTQVPSPKPHHDHAHHYHAPSFFVSNGKIFTRYPYMHHGDHRSSIIFDIMSHYRMPQLIINTKPYLIKVPQARIVET